MKTAGAASESTGISAGRRHHRGIRTRFPGRGVRPRGDPGALTGCVAGTTTDIAHGAGNTFYVGGEVWRANAPVQTEGIIWAMTCTPAQCRQIHRQIHRQVLTTFGLVLAVNGRGMAAGYSRPNGDGAGFNFVWTSRATATVEVTPLALNTSGQIAAWRPIPATTRLEAVLLTPSP